MAMDEAHRDTDRKIAELEKKIREIYAEATRETQEKFDEFTRKFKAKDEKKREDLKAGKITKEQYQNWLRGQVFQGKQWRYKVEQMADTLVHYDLAARAIINDEMAGVFQNNANWIAYKLEHDAGLNLSFGIYSKDTVARLLKSEPKLLPAEDIKKAIDHGWNVQQIGRQITQSIIQGEGILQAAKRLQKVVGADENFAMSAARTAMTSAQNAGRQITMQRAEKMGLKIKKEWLATLDSHTRASHRELDGQQVDIDEPFHYMGKEVMYPGDPYADPKLVRNCRCTMVTAFTEFPEENEERRDNINGQVIKSMNYKQWQKAKEEAGEIEGESGSSLKKKIEKILEKPKTQDSTKKHKITENEKEAAEWYVSGEGQFINQYYRGNTNIRLSDQEKRMASNLETLANSEIVEQKTLYRSVDAQAVFGKLSDSQYSDLRDDVFRGKESKYKKVIGKRITEKGFTSTTKSKEVAAEWGDFTGSTKPVVIEFEVPNGVRGYDMREFDVEGDEQYEVLLSRGQEYEIIGISAEGITIHDEEEGDYKENVIYIKARIIKKEGD